MREFLTTTLISILVAFLVVAIVFFGAFCLKSYSLDKKINETIEEKVEQIDIFKVRKYNENVYDLVGIEGWFYINEEENEYSIQFYELGDWDYECKNIKELKNILATYYIQKYDIETTEAIEKVNLIFDNI